MTFEDRLTILDNNVTQAKMDFEESTKKLLQARHASKQELNCTNKTKAIAAY
jgi:hypothetical protein